MKRNQWNCNIRVSFRPFAQNCQRQSLINAIRRKSSASGREIYRAKENHWKSIIFVAELNTLQLPSQSAKMFRMNKNAYSTIKPQNEPYIPQRRESCSPYQMYFATKIILIHHHNRILTKELVIKSIYRICTVLKTIPVRKRWTIQAKLIFIWETILRQK